MDDRRLGASLRALRRRRGLRQRDLAAAAGTQQSVVSRIEAGRVGSFRVDTVRAVFGALDAELTLLPQWRGGALDRLLDERHAALVERVVAVLGQTGWKPEVEVSYSRYGERGSIDVLGVRAQSAAIVVVEVKSELVTIEGTLRPMDAKTRLAPIIARERFGWRPTVVGRLLVLPEASTARRRVASHRATLDVAFPARGVEARRWLETPTGTFSGILFLAAIPPAITGHDARQAIVTRERVRRGRRPGQGIAASVQS